MHVNCVDSLVQVGTGSTSIANATSGGLSFYQLLINSGHYNTQVCKDGIGYR